MLETLKEDNRNFIFWLGHTVTFKFMDDALDDRNFLEIEELEEILPDLREVWISARDMYHSANLDLEEGLPNATSNDKTLNQYWMELKKELKKVIPQILATRYYCSK